MRILVALILTFTLAAAQKLDDTPRIAVISAFAPELGVLLEQTDITDTYLINGRTFTLGTLSGQEVVLFLSGISITNAAMTTQLALERFTVSAIIFSGIAGGVNPELAIGDVTVPARWGQYQEGFFARALEDGWDLGWHDDPFGNYGMMFPQYVDFTGINSEPDAVEERFWFAVDADMLRVAESLTEVDLTSCTPEDICLDHDPRVVVGGNGVSGSTFVDNAEYREWVWETFSAQALDMETAAVGHVAHANGVPYIAFRSLSDLAGGGPGENEVMTFLGLAANNSATLVTRFLEVWGQQ